jgi:Dictyostelium (slime mold) repeat
VLQTTGRGQRSPQTTVGGLVVVAMLLGVVAPEASFGLTRVVDDDNVQCASAPFHTINAALAVSEPGDEIMLCAGTYDEQVILRDNHPIRGIPDGFVLPRIAPTSLPNSVPAVESGNPVAAALTVVRSAVRIENVVVDLSGYAAPGCSPITAGIFLSNASGTLVNTTIIGAAGARAECDSGVGLLVDSGTINPGILGHIIAGRSMVSARVMTFQGNQRAAVAAVGARTVVRVIEALVEGDGLGQPFVQHGFQYSEGGRGKLQDIRLRNLGTALAGKTAVGLLACNSDRVRTRRATMDDVQTGAFFVGNRHRLAAGRFKNIHADGVVIFGDKNRVLKTEMTVASVDGVFLDGDQNLIRGGGYSDMPIGIWDYIGVGNRADQIEFIRVPERVRIGGVRDLTPDSASCFTLTCASAVECDDGNACTTDACDPGGTCVNTILDDGTPCDDATVCNGSETCGAGLCVGGTALDCDDGDPCSTDTCDAVTGCAHTLLPDGSPCDDATVCNGSETCVADVCTPGTPLVCDDGNACTTDSCDPALGCQHTAVTDGQPCGDLDPCNGAETCVGGTCMSGPPAGCSDSNPCTTEMCVPGVGCQFTNVGDGTPCDDLTVCNGAETCLGGFCTPGTQLMCDDANPCTTDACDAALGCQHTALPDGASCDDSTVCNGAEMCSAGVCQPGTPLVCDDLNPCTDDACDSSSGCFAINDDTNPCDDFNACTSPDWCQAGTCGGTMTVVALGCSNNDACDGLEMCNPATGLCEPGFPVTCDDTNECTIDTCDSLTGLCQFNPVTDGIPCTGGTCLGGFCLP